MKTSSSQPRSRGTIRTQPSSSSAESAVKRCIKVALIIASPAHTAKGYAPCVGRSWWRLKIINSRPHKKLSLGVFFSSISKLLLECECLIFHFPSDVNEWLWILNFYCRRRALLVLKWWRIIELYTFIRKSTTNIFLLSSFPNNIYNIARNYVIIMIRLEYFGILISNRFVLLLV
jgi:hypothetical protein